MVRYLDVGCRKCTSENDDRNRIVLFTRLVFFLGLGGEVSFANSEARRMHRRYPFSSNKCQCHFQHFVSAPYAVCNILSNSKIRKLLVSLLWCIISI
jgi:hypothetical protein